MMAARAVTAQPGTRLRRDAESGFRQLSRGVSWYGFVARVHQARRGETEAF